MRNFSKPIRRLQRTVKTNQRIYFDLSPGEKWLVSGDTDGLVRIWDLKSESDTEDLTVSSSVFHIMRTEILIFAPEIIVWLARRLL